MTGTRHYEASRWQHTRTQTGGFGQTLAEVSQGSDSRDAFVRSKVTEASESVFEYTEYSACLTGTGLRMGEMSLDSGIIGLSFVRGTEEPMSARMDKSSTAENPVVLVQVGSGKDRRDYRIAVNEVNTENATELEMFALLNYMDAQNGKTMAPDGAWQTYNALRNRLEETGAVDSVTGEGDYDTIRVSWLEMMRQAMEDELLREKGWFSERFFEEDLEDLLQELDAYKKEPKDLQSMSFWELMNSGAGREQINVVDRIVSARNSEDQRIYVTFFTRESILCRNADGTTAWELMPAGTGWTERVEEIFAGFKPDRDIVKEYYSDAALGFVASKNFWLELLGESLV